MSVLIIHIPSMCCPVEGAAVEKAAGAIPGVAGIVCDYASRTARITHKGLDPDKLLAALAELGMPAEVISTGARRIVLSVPEMDCPVEAGEIQKAFGAAGIAGADFNVMNRTITLTGDDALEAAAVAAVSRCGYRASPMQNRRSEPEAAPIPWRLYISALAVALLSEVFDLASEYAPDMLPLPETAVSAVTLALAVAAIAMVGLTTFRNGLSAVLHGNLNMNALMAVAVTGGVLIGAWPEAAMVMVLFQISEAIEQLSMTRARRSIRDLMNTAPETASVRHGDRFEEVPAESVGPGAVVRVAPGDRIPLDGRILKGSTSIDQSSVTGEGLPAEKSVGDTVWSGTVNLTAAIEVLVTAASSESLASRIIDAVENAQASKSPVQRFVDRFAVVYTPIVFAIALAAAVIPPLFDGDWFGWIYKALCLLVISCPCALVISTPVTI
ncbi:MAG: heavy metal translocating P-type ATPase, partial [Sutterella sp.]